MDNQLNLMVKYSFYETACVCTLLLLYVGQVKFKMWFKKMVSLKEDMALWSPFRCCSCIFIVLICFIARKPLSFCSWHCLISFTPILCLQIARFKNRLAQLYKDEIPEIIHVEQWDCCKWWDSARLAWNLNWETVLESFKSSRANQS